MKGPRQGRGRSLLGKRLITGLDGASGIQGTGENLQTTPHSEKGQKNKEAWQKRLDSDIDRCMRRRPILLNTEDLGKGNTLPVLAYVRSDLNLSMRRKYHSGSKGKWILRLSVS